MIHIHLERDSIGLYDEVHSPHSLDIKLRDHANLHDLISALFRHEYFPHVPAGIATWVVEFKHNPLAVVKWGGGLTLYLMNEHFDIQALADAENHVSFTLIYKDQHDALEVYEHLKTFGGEHETQH